MRSDRAQYIALAILAAMTFSVATYALVFGPDISAYQEHFWRNYRSVQSHSGR